MKLTLGAIFIMFGAMASDSVILDQEKVRLYSSNAILEKTIDTPEVLDLIVPVTEDVIKCEPGYDRTVTRRNGAECGYDLVVEHCNTRGPRYRGNGRPHYNVRPHVYPQRRRSGRQVMPAPRRSFSEGRRTFTRPAPRMNCMPFTRKVPKLCSYSVCDKKYIETETVMKKLTVDFSEFKDDETFEFSLNQHGDVTFLPIYSAPTCTKLTVYGNPPYITGVKVSQKDNWWNWSCK